MTGRRPPRRTPAGHERNRIVWLSTSEANRIVLIAVSIVVMSISLVWTMSQSGIVSFTCAVGCFAWLMARRRHVGLKRRLIVITTLGVVVGTGINIYPDAMLFYQRNVLEFWMTHAHNDYLQLLATGGLLVFVPATIAAVLLAIAIGRHLSEARDDSYDYWVRAGAGVGLIVIGIQETVEFSLHIPANALLFTTLAAVAISPTTKPNRGMRDAPALGSSPAPDHPPRSHNRTLKTSVLIESRDAPLLRGRPEALPSETRTVAQRLWTAARK